MTSNKLDYDAIIERAVARGVPEEAFRDAVVNIQHYCEPFRHHVFWRLVVLVNIQLRLQHYKLTPGEILDIVATGE